VRSAAPEFNFGPSSTPAVKRPTKSGLFCERPPHQPSAHPRPPHDAPSRRALTMPPSRRPAVTLHWPERPAARLSSCAARCRRVCPLNSKISVRIRTAPFVLHLTPRTPRSAKCRLLPAFARRVRPQSSPAEFVTGGVRPCSYQPSASRTENQCSNSNSTFRSARRTARPTFWQVSAFASFRRRVRPQSSPAELVTGGVRPCSYQPSALSNRKSVFEFEQHFSFCATHGRRVPSQTEARLRNCRRKLPVIAKGERRTLARPGGTLARPGGTLARWAASVRDGWLACATERLACATERHARATERHARATERHARATERLACAMGG
jgi:hypothetical protein